jgi:phospholipid/cholesterol/gamma-HCH transport system permease protein
MVSYFRAVARAWSVDRPLGNRDIQKIVLRQIYFTGSQAFRLVALAALVLGIVTIAQSSAQLQRLGGTEGIGAIVAGLLFREAAPFVTLMVVVSRSVSAMASELATMKANGEVDSLRASGVSVLSYLVIPRVVGGSISTLLLAMHFAWVAIMVGFFSARLFVDLSWSLYFDNLLVSLTLIDVVLFVVKSLGLSAIAFFIATYCGLRTTGAAFEVPQATTKAVVWSLMFCLVAQTLISLMYFMHAVSVRGFGGLM